MANSDMNLVEVTTPKGRHYQLQISPNKPIIVRRIIFGRTEQAVKTSSEEWNEAIRAYEAQGKQERPIGDLVGEVRSKGMTHKIYRCITRYSISTDDVLTQRDLTADEFVRWACHAMEDGS